MLQSPHCGPSDAMQLLNTLVIYNDIIFVERPEQVQALDGQQLCVVCGDLANGIHFGVTSCEGCKVSIHSQGGCVHMSTS